MVDVVSIVIAALSLLGTIASATLTGWFAFFTEERKQRSEAEKLFRKYHDPLLQAANDLQSRCFNIVQPGGGILHWMYRDETRKANLIQYTCFLVGQYLSWAYILRRQAQFLPLPKDSINRHLRTTMNSIEFTMRVANSVGRLGRPFQLWTGDQMAIGEVMTIKEDGELYSMGYAAFRQKWSKEEAFRKWFQSLVEDLEEMAEAGRQKPPLPIPDHRLRQLQHLLIELMLTLDPQKLKVDLHRVSRCDPKADYCVCSTCKPESEITPRRRKPKVDMA